jgi:hypothetical protein
MSDSTTQQQQSNSSSSQSQGSQDWRTSLPEDIRNHESLKDIKDVEGLAKSYVNVQPLIGRDKLILPTEKSTPEEWDKFFTKLGRPSKPEEYDFSKVRVNNMVPNEEVVKDFSPTAHKIGLSKSQAQGVMEWLMTLGSKELQSLDEELAGKRKAAKDQLTAEYGAALPETLQIARSAALWAGGEDLVKLFDDEGWASNPAMVRALVKVGKAVAEDVLSPAVSGHRGAMTPDQAKKRIAELQTDPAYYNRSAPTHEAVIKEISDLSQSAWPEGAGKPAVARMGFGY